MAERRTPTEMTKWEAGQVLIKASDKMFECSAELRSTQPDFADTLYHMGCQVGSMLNRFESHSFGLRGLQDCICPACKNLASTKHATASEDK